MSRDEKLVMRALKSLGRGGEVVSFSAIGDAAGLDARRLSATWAALILKGHVEMRPALTNAGLAAMGQRAA